ncbi:uncharacterized protein LOC114291074 [Camellia sinensis]|uniref:uncharacterized protein LOC114291074 n=1 Tax=Camellia sinensis TaxID=4442 RepID=UPI0010358867|nr:uncharacterized protein LOC114291074 [Camellia sinensis]
MSLWSRDEALMCKVFPSSLGETGLRWFDRLLAGSIHGWKQLSEEFLARFVSNTKISKEPDTLFGLRKEQEETLRSYARRYWEEYNDLEENVCSEQMAVMPFKHGLRPESKLRQSLTKRPTTALKNLRAKIEQYTRLEDDQILIEVVSAQQTARHKKKTDRGEHRGLTVNEVDKSKSHEAVVTNCRALKQHLEDLVAAGHLRDYIDQYKEVTEPGNPPPEPNTEHPPRLIINVIHGTATQGCEEALKEEIAKAVEIQQVISVEPASKKDLTPATAPLVGFNSQLEWPLGRIVLPVVAGTKALQTEFLVINTPSPYNVILGRPWIHQMEAVPLTYHQLIRFPTEYGVEQISEDQVASKHCFMAALKAKQLCNQVQTMEMAEQPVLEDVGGAPEEKIVEDLEKVLVKKDDPEKYFLIGLDLEFACHKLNINPSARPIVQKSRRSSVEHTEAVIAEVEKLLASGAIREV